jgi:DNA polymerase-3 subunit delta
VDVDVDVDVDDAESLDLPVFTKVMTALESPPFMTAVRVVVVRGIGNLTKDQAAWLAGWIAAPLETTRLVLVTGGGRIPAALDKALKAAGATTLAANESVEQVLASAAGEAGVALSAAAAARVLAHLGDDAGRVPSLVEVLATAYGPGSTLDVADVEPFLGAMGTAEPFALTNALDRGDVAGVLVALHRSLRATSGKSQQARPMHPMQVMAMVTGHYQRLLRLDHPTIATPDQAAGVLGMKNARAASFRLQAARALGTEGLREVFALLAQAELDLRGASGVDDETVLEILLARLANLTRRRMPTRRATSPGRR